MLSDVETEEFIWIYVEIIWIYVENSQEELRQSEVKKESQELWRKGEVNLQKHSKQHLFNLYYFNYALSVRRIAGTKKGSRCKSTWNIKIALIITQYPQGALCFHPAHSLCSF